ncbi:MAG TPA: hypothetical protein PLU30_17255 [Verrucomicrobiae bacterium]|nr:hypothetical protein [Verrucomicrobiae bacterium]
MTRAQWLLMVRTRRPDDDDGDTLAQIERTEEAGRLIEEYRTVAARLADRARQDQWPEEAHG